MSLPLIQPPKVCDRPRDVQIEEIADQTWVLRSRTWDLLKFEVEYSRQQGTTANTYLIRAQQTVLIDPPGASFTELFCDALKQTIALSEIDIIVIQHINPNRIATLRQLLPHMPQAQIVCSKPAAIALQKAMPDLPQVIQTVRSGDLLSIDSDRTLQFSFIPTPRWADALCTFDSQTQILFTDKLFGTHICGEDLWDMQWKTLQADRQHYFDCLFAPQSKQTKSALAKISAYPARLYAPGHGPMIRYSLSRLTPEYWQWCEQQQQTEMSVALCYASAYGNTATMAQAIAQSLIQEGIQVQAINCETTNPLDIPDIFEGCDGVIIGSPTLGGHPPVQIQTALGQILESETKQKLVGVFGSYGWNGEAIDLIESKFKDAGFRFGFEPLRVRFSPSSDDLESCRQAGMSFATALRKHKKKQRPTVRSLVTAQTDRTAQAMGRVVGSHCVVTYMTVTGYRSLMTSWVSQASFSPPGLMLAVDGHLEEKTFFQPRTAFGLHILQEGKNLRRHFRHGRTQGLILSEELPGSYTEQGGLVLQEALVYLDCQVEQRMRCGDRWLIYARVDSGEVLDPIGQAAIHHRASGREL